MNKSSLRFFGIGLFLAGAIFQLQSNFSNEEITSTHVTDREALQKSREELKNVKQQLAQLQLDLENAKTVQAVVEPKDGEQEEPSKGDDKSILIIESGMNSKGISLALEEKGIIQNKQDFEDYLTTQNLTGRIQIGEYELDSSMTIKQIAEIITKK